MNAPGTDIAKALASRDLIALAKRGEALLDQVSTFIIPPAANPTEVTPEQLARGPILIGLWTFFIVFVVFGLWAALAPLDSAAIAAGNVVLDTNRKTIQHLEGGIVKTIFVREGDFVRKGAPLIRLDETAARAKLDLLQGQYVAVRAAEARLIAERDNLPEIKFSKDLLALDGRNPVATENLDTQRRLFKSRRDNLEGQIAILNQKIEQFKKEIEGLEAQEVSATRQIALLEEEIASVRKLLSQGLAMKPRLLALERQAAELRGQRGDHVARISRSQQSIAEAEIQMINFRNEFLKDLVAELRDTQVKVSDLSEQIRASADTVSRIVIAAPLGGVVTGLKVHTLGGVIAPGEKIMDIVPRDDKLIVEAKLHTRDIDVVRTGLKARVRLSAFKTRSVPPVIGKVIHVSPDRFVEERTGEAYYLARIEIPHSEFKGLKYHGRKVELYPGMPTDVLIVTGERSMLSYLFNPILDSLNHAFREQ